MCRILFLVIAILAGLSAARADANPRRVAVVVGVGAYQSVPTLANPPRDARAIAAALKQLGFDTTLVIDPDRAALEQAVRTLGDKSATADAAVFFYAGHALEADGRNYIIPVNAKIASLRDLPFETVDLDLVGQQVEGRARTIVVFMDACRDNPFAARLAASARGIRPGGGLAAPQSDSSGTLVAYATAPGHTAEDGAGTDSPFTTALLAHIATPGLEVRQMLGLVRHDVREATDGKQVPWESSALEGAFYFNPGPAGLASAGDAVARSTPVPGGPTPGAGAAVAPPSTQPMRAAGALAAQPPPSPSSSSSTSSSQRAATGSAVTVRPAFPGQFASNDALPGGLGRPGTYAMSRCHVDPLLGPRSVGGSATVMRVVSDGRGCAFRMFKHPLERVPYDSLVASTPPSNGRVTVNDNSQIVYTPRPGFVGEDMFVVDGVPHRSLTVRVIVRPPLPPSPDQPG